MCDVEPFDWDVWPFTELDVEGMELMMFNTKKGWSTRKRWTSWLNGVKGRAVQKTNNFNFGLPHAVTRYCRPVTHNLALNFNFMDLSHCPTFAQPLPNLCSSIHI
jgi:hypothetical protein